MQVQRQEGIVFYDSEEIIIFIEEQLKMVPGIIYFQKPGIIRILRSILNLPSGKIKIYQINKNEIYIELGLGLSKEIDYLKIEEEIKKVLKYSLYKKYGLNVTNIEIYIQDLL
ncbi:MAG: hypothetical protein ACK5HR_03830 [Mycoplasmatales bacterium]